MHLILKLRMKILLYTALLKCWRGQMDFSNIQQYTSANKTRKLKSKTSTVKSDSWQMCKCVFLCYCYSFFLENQRLMTYISLNLGTVIITKRPSNPTKVIEGVNNSGILLVWDYILEGNESITILIFRRERAGSQSTTIATKIENRQFNLARDDLRLEFEATPTATLKLLTTVKNSDEYEYLLDITFRDSGGRTRLLRERVSVQVFGEYRWTYIIKRHP